MKKLLKPCPICKTSKYGCYKSQVVWKGKKIWSTRCGMVNMVAEKMWSNF